MIVSQRAKSDPPMVIAALMPRMLQLAAAETNGTFPVYITPEQTARMRAALGADKWICIQQVALLEKDPAKAPRGAQGASILSEPSQLPEQLPEYGVRRRGFRRRWKRSPGGRVDRVG